MLRLHYDLAFVEHGPLPPHERTWRHPSELAAEEHALARAESPPATTRVFAFTTGSLGLLAVGLLMLAVTPSRSGAPVAISATTTPESAGGSVTVIATVAAGPSDRAPLGLRGAADALATPIGEGRYAVVTAVDLGTGSGGVAIGDAVDVEVPSGRLHEARIVGRSGDTVLVELERAEPGVDVADDRPAGDDIVTVLAEPPITIVLADLATLRVEEGTAVLDDDGLLVGLCSQELGAATRLVAVGVEAATTAPDDFAVTDPTGAATGDRHDPDPIDHTSDDDTSADHTGDDHGGDDHGGDGRDDGLDGDGALSEVLVDATSGG